MTQNTSTVDWKQQVGLMVWMPRIAAADFEPLLGRLAEMGYREIEPANGYQNLEPKAFRAVLDKHGMRMRATRTAASAPSVAELERVLEGLAIMGIKYTEVSIGAGRGGGGGAAGAGGGGGRQGGGAPRGGGPGGAPGGGPGGAGPGGGNAPGRGAGGPGGTAPGAPGGGAPGAGRGATAPLTVESVKQRAAQLNEYGKVLQKFGMKVIFHNHTAEFDLLDDGKTTQHELMIQETDPALVTMELDLGWAHIAGQDVLAMFRRHPGRFECWHVKDAVGIKYIDQTLKPSQRTAMFVPVGLGEIDYKTMFANAGLAGLKHFHVEQDNENAWGNQEAAWKVSANNLLTRIL